MSIHDFLDEIPSEGEDFFASEEKEQEKDVPAEESEKESEEEKPASEGDKSEDKSDDSEESKDESEDTDAEDSKESIKFPPLHEHPRFKKVYKEKKEKDREIEELRRELEEIKTQAPQSNTQSVQVPEYAAQLGYTQETWDAFNKQEAERAKEQVNTIKEQLKQELLAEKEAEAKKEADTQRQLNDYLESEKVRITKEFNLTESDMNSVMKLAVKKKPFDSYGVLDIEKAYYMWALDNKSDNSSTEKKKKVASMMNSDSSSTDAPISDIQSPETLRNRDWLDLVQN